MHPQVDIEDPGSLDSYLRRRDLLSGSDPLRARVLSGGVSNRVVLLERPGKTNWVLKQALDKLRVPVDWFCSPRRIEREAAGMRWLRRLAPDHITPLIFCDPDQHILAMEAVAEPHSNWKTMLLAGSAGLELFVQFGRLLASIHTGGVRHAHELATEFADRSYFQALRLEPYYAYTAGQVPEAAAFLTDLIASTLSKRVTIVHGDYSPKNILVQEGRLVLLDHEVIHWGDPAFDVGFAMAHFISKARHLRSPSMIDGARAYWRTYTSVYAADEAACVRHTIGCVLARAAGRSQLEYLTEVEKQAQKRLGLELLEDVPREFESLMAKVCI